MAAWVNRVVQVPAQVAESGLGPAAPVAGQVLAPVGVPEPVGVPAGAVAVN